MTLTRELDTIERSALADLFMMFAQEGRNLRHNRTPEAEDTLAGDPASGANDAQRQTRREMHDSTNA